MFEHFVNFFGAFQVTKSNEISIDKFSSLQRNTDGFIELFNSHNAECFGKGLYRLHDLSNIEYWNGIISDAFPEFSDRISCFGYDWMGRQFTLDMKRIVNGQPQILMFEPGTGEVLRIPCNFIDFHDDEIPNYHNDCLASDFYFSWKSQFNDNLEKDECVGYKVILFLGGEDVVGNLEKSNMEVYWDICGQLRTQTKDLSEGTLINIINIDK
ncbi:T6SS immunity protein Tdi1 domain-containing protein [Paenibacillus pini]|uniref:T6SS immunity protein Tdi1 C-terminal domain-containing protein n=1 Tax=Paenibacillus pini JCM 16418 TaxID=1236976 RepID=W7YFP4_9BACL|nr:T6SS immunity protein Tdi1 domain-containing protein [Paenibacillus pini]GAF06338.1 hypothetical protein JCM16418_289 [Paenibacillus pini JCM 16418]